MTRSHLLWDFRSTEHRLCEFYVLTRVLGGYPHIKPRDYTRVTQNSCGHGCAAAPQTVQSCGSYHKLPEHVQFYKGFDTAEYQVRQSPADQPPRPRYSISARSTTIKMQPKKNRTPGWGPSTCVRSIDGLSGVNGFLGAGAALVDVKRGDEISCGDDSVFKR